MGDAEAVGVPLRIIASGLESNLLVCIHRYAVLLREHRFTQTHPLVLPDLVYRHRRAVFRAADQYVAVLGGDRGADRICPQPCGEPERKDNRQMGRVQALCLPFLRIELLGAHQRERVFAFVSRRAKTLRHRIGCVRRFCRLHYIV